MTKIEKALDLLRKRGVGEKARAKLEALMGESEADPLFVAATYLTAYNLAEALAEFLNSARKDFRETGIRSSDQMHAIASVAALKVLTKGTDEGAAAGAQESGYTGALKLGEGIFVALETQYVESKGGIH